MFWEIVFVEVSDYDLAWEVWREYDGEQASSGRRKY